VGFELFNNSDFGMTEFAQRINYQRALQGELTRTILALSEVRDVRVLLALPEQGLFKRERSKATASITLTLKPGRALALAQVSGIQRLVAAAVPGIASQDVTIVDQSGVALSRPSGEGEAEVGAGRLDLKRDTEVYLTRKATEVLDQALGAGEALASVDVTLDMDRTQTTTEDVVGAPGAGGRTQAGVVVRERETVRELGTPLTGQSSVGAGAGGQGGSSQREVEYAVGRRTEQVIVQPGAIRRLQIVAVVKKPVDAGQQEQLRRLVAASVGAVPERGDTVVVQPITALTGQPVVAAAAGTQPGDSSPVARAVQPGVQEATGRFPRPVLAAMAVGLVALAVVVTGLLLGALLRRRRPKMAPVVKLSDAERRAALGQVQGWLRAGATSRGAGEAR
jgi:flagellar M-ring protein FliF